MGSTSTHIMGRFIYFLAFIGSVASLESNRFFTGIASGLDCCSRTTELCTTPCAGQECTSMCEVRCGFLGSIVCTPLACSAANSAGCISAAPCADGYTQVDSKCMKVVAGPSNYLDAITGCIAEGATLATIESQAEQASPTGGTTSQTTETTINTAPGSDLMDSGMMLLARSHRHMCARCQQIKTDFMRLRPSYLLYL